jgi:hypothetical protein
LSSKKIYVITSEVHVRKNVRVSIEDGATILLQNGLNPKLKLRRAALIFEPGSILRAQSVSIKACNADFKPVKNADNGGVWFLGNSQSGAKDTVKVSVNRKSPLSSFQAKSISTHYLGRYDPVKELSRSLVVQDDIDGFSIIGVSPQEWQVSEIRSFHSADDGIDLTNSHIQLDKLIVRAPVEDGINLSSSRLEINKSLLVDASKTKVKDRDIVDFETDDGPSFLVLYSGCQMDIKGVFGDQVVLSSEQMPKVITKSDNERSYKFKGKLKKSALIYSLDQD